ncbi:TIGR00159 family protein [Catalinimonas alkaloidigena]|uniref:Diadenylate cyclase n=2 Tax=Catalinimonas alkaloidigena TaxID=1075417 RepID=A0A1G9MUR9_9BACT|nr:TIGR00159 family protein [Catalinimonas alkaloidigena]
MLLFPIGFLEVTFVDVAEILLVGYLLYQLYKLMRGSVAIRIFIGIISIYLLYLIVKATGMELLTGILGQFIDVGVIAAIVVFQQEIRKFLMVIGKSTFFNNDFFLRSLLRRNANLTNLNLQPVLEAAKAMSGTNTGGLIVFAKSSELKFYAESGDILDAKLSKRLLLSIFYKNSPLHDGAVIIYNNQVKAARCILPVTENTEVPASLGLRHRAALGMSEATDSVVLIISEETGQMSLAFNGRLEHNLSITELRDKINHYLNEDVDEEEVVPETTPEEDSPILHTPA